MIRETKSPGLRKISPSSTAKDLLHRQFSPPELFSTVHVHLFQNFDRTIPSIDSLDIFPGMGGRDPVRKASLPEKGKAGRASFSEKGKGGKKSGKGTGKSGAARPSNGVNLSHRSTRFSDFNLSHQERVDALPLTPAMLTSHIKNAWTLDDLLQTWSSHKDVFDHIHLSACWSSIGRLASAAPRSTTSPCCPQHPSSAASTGSCPQTRLASLTEKTVLVVTTSSKIQARQLANIAHGVAKSAGNVEGSFLSPKILMDALATRLLGSEPGNLTECNAQELANVAWAFAKTTNCCGKLLRKLFTALSTAARPYLGYFKAQELANLAWAFATVGLGGAAEEELFKVGGSRGRTSYVPKHSDQITFVVTKSHGVRGAS